MFSGTTMMVPLRPCNGVSQYLSKSPMVHTKRQTTVRNIYMKAQTQAVPSRTQREQEWNISRKELMELVEAGILNENDIEEATAVSFNPPFNSHMFIDKVEVHQRTYPIPILPLQLTIQGPHKDSQ
ncbi:hypothetical protein QQP08_002912 [Theobroma cacao]|nr:hypothetical protein QQP08_002912 [Theobroma cacao]